MGLDQYAFSVKPHREDTPFDFALTDTKEELQYWRKHPNLQGWMENLWREKRAKNGITDDEGGGEWNSFNCVYVELTYNDLTDLENAILGKELPHTEGFFFGEESDDYYREADLEFIAKARQVIAGDYRVYYYSWW